MLTIPQRLPIKQMAVYGSTAMLVGFTSTLVMLRQFVPKDSPTGVSVVETINKKPANAVTASLETKQSTDQSTASATQLPDQGGLVVRNSNLPAQQYSRVSTATPTYTAPAGPTAPASANQGVTVGGTMPQETISQPSGSQPASNDTTTQSGLQETISNTNIIDINAVRLP